MPSGYLNMVSRYLNIDVCYLNIMPGWRPDTKKEKPQPDFSSSLQYQQQSTHYSYGKTEQRPQQNVLCQPEILRWLDVLEPKHRFRCYQEAHCREIVRYNERHYQYTLDIANPLASIRQSLVIRDVWTPFPEYAFYQQRCRHRHQRIHNEELPGRPAFKYILYGRPDCSHISGDDEPYNTQHAQMSSLVQQEVSCTVRRLSRLRIVYGKMC